MAVFHSIWTVILFVIFIGIVWWAWGKPRKRAFDEAARLPLDDDEVRQPAVRGRERGED